MFVCYLDESGDTGTLPSSTSPVQPVLCILALSLDLDRLRDFTFDFINLKTKFFPGRFPVHSNWLRRILVEIKGSEIRSSFQRRKRRFKQVHHHIGFFNDLLDLVERYDCKIFGRVWIKGIASPLDSWSPYTSSIQAICSTFQNLLEAKDQQGCVILDPRTKTQDQRVSFSIFTQKFKASGDEYPRIVEMSTFGQGENHAGIQVADLLCSGLLSPIAAYSYCSGYINNIHVDPGYGRLKTRYGIRLQHLQHRYSRLKSGRLEWLGGIVTSDPLGYRDGRRLFK